MHLALAAKIFAENLGAELLKFYIYKYHLHKFYFSFRCLMNLLLGGGYWILDVWDLGFDCCSMLSGAKACHCCSRSWSYFDLPTGRQALYDTASHTEPVEVRLTESQTATATAAATATATATACHLLLP